MLEKREKKEIEEGRGGGWKHWGKKRKKNREDNKAGNKVVGKEKISSG